MAFTTFPAFAQFMLDGYQVAPVPPVERTEMDDGFVLQAPTQSLSRFEIPLTYRLCSLADQEAFEAWRRLDLRHGALWFRWVDVRFVDGSKIRRARLKGGEVVYKPLTTRLDDWTATFTLEYYA